MKNEFQHYQDALNRPTGMLLRAYVSADDVDKEATLRIFADDGRGNGDHIATIPWALAKTAFAK